MVYLWDQVKEGTKRYIARQSLIRLFKFGHTFSSAFKWLKPRKLTYRRQNMLDDWRALLGIEKKRIPLKHVPKKHKPTIGVIEEVKDRQHNRYKFTYKVTLRDTETGLLTERFVSLGSNKLRKMGLIDEMAGVIARSFKYSEQDRFEFIEVERESIKKTANFSSKISQV